MKESFATVLEAVARARPQAIAVSHAGREVSWRELEDQAARLPHHLQDVGIGHGCRVAVAQYNGAEYLATLWAALKVRAVPVNVNFRYKADEITALFDDAHVEAAVYDGALAGTVEPAAAAATTPLRTAVVLHTEAPGHGRVGYDEVQRTCAPLAATQRGDDDWLMYTGGTTGRPRGVLVRHSWLYDVICANSFLLMGLRAPATLAELETYLASVASDTYPIVTIPAPPLMHATGSYTSLGALVAGGRVAYLAGRSYDADELLRLIEQQRADTVSIVGDVFARPMADALDRAQEAGRPYDLSSLRRVLSVGVTWSAECKRRLLRHGDFLCRDIVAASEGGPFAVSQTRRGDHVTTARFSLVPGARIVDETGRDVVPGSGQVGMLAAPTDEYIHYQGDEEKTAKTFRVFDGRRWAVPGDLASIDEDGTVTFHGRGSQVINTGGEKVFAEEVENVVVRHPAVRDAMVVGVPDARWGHRVAAVVSLREGESLTLDQLKEHVGRELANYKRPTVLVLTDEVKRSPSGKADTRWARAVATEKSQRHSSASPVPVQPTR